MIRAIRPLLAVMVLVFLGVFAGGCMTTPDGGQIGVVRNGGPFDNKNIRQIIPNGSGNTWNGFASTTHYYPASDQQRVYKFDDSKDADADPVTVPTKDGVQVRLTGTFYLNTAFDNSPQGKDLLKKFDTSFGTRGFGPDDQRPWESFGSFLTSIVEPVIDSNLREVIAEFDCKDIVSSCALVQRGQSTEVDVSELVKGESNVTAIQNRVNENLADEVKAKLGNPYFKTIRFSLGPVTLPGVQDAIDKAQSAFAAVSSSQARVEQARQDRKANEERQKGYNTCTSCARQDELKALPSGLTTYAPGNSAGVAVK